MVILGGVGTLDGALLGSAAYLLAEEWLSGITENWMLGYLRVPDGDNRRGLQTHANNCVFPAGFPVALNSHVFDRLLGD